MGFGVILYEIKLERRYYINLSCLFLSSCLVLGEEILDGENLLGRVSFRSVFGYRSRVRIKKENRYKLWIEIERNIGNRIGFSN